MQSAPARTEAHAASAAVSGAVRPTRSARAPFTAALSLALACTVLLLAAAPASAIQEYLPGATFGEPGEGPGQFHEPEAVAVNDSLTEPTAGDVYVLNRQPEGHQRLLLLISETRDHGSHFAKLDRKRQVQLPAARSTNTSMVITWNP